MLMSYDRTNNFSAQNLALSIPANALYEDLLFEYIPPHRRLAA
jgi:hypothetical protein